jgi:ArsR family transcriptional regulator, lead/cadmium/zinc/bismuth-responsive transcriptional repressor
MEVTNMSQSAISHQLSKLKQTRLVKSDKRGKNVFYSLNDDHVQQIFRQAQEHARE